MITLKQFIPWLNKPETKKETVPSKYTIDDDIYKYIRQIHKEQKEKFEKNKRLIKSMNNKIGHLPSSVSTKIVGTSISESIMNVTSGNITVNGDMIVKDRDILKELDEMRDALLLLKRDVDMESKYPRLKELKDEYERELAKYKTFDALRGSK